MTADEYLTKVESECARLQRENAYLRSAVDLLSLPRVTDEDIKTVRDGLLLLQGPKETIQ